MRVHMIISPIVSGRGGRVKGKLILVSQRRHYYDDRRIHVFPANDFASAGNQPFLVGAVCNCLTLTLIVS